MSSSRSKHLRIAVMGTGGVGGYFGARLAEVGYALYFIARDAHLAALRQNGLLLRSMLGDAHVVGATATDNPAEIGPVDVVMFTVKLYDTESAAALCKPLVGPDTVVISFLNGIDSEQALGCVVGDEHVAGGVARISASIESPGVIAHHGEFASLEFGELDGGESERLARFLAACEDAGIQARMSPTIVQSIWRKFVFLSSFAAVTTLTRLPIGPIRDSPPTFSLFERAVHEVVAVADAKGVELAHDEADKVIKFTREMDGDIKASMLVDLERNRRLEVEWLSGAVVRLGLELGIATPVHEMVLAALLPHALGRAR